MKTPKAPKQPTPPPAAPPPPTIDEAARNSEDADRMRRRKGRLATIFADRRAGGGITRDQVAQKSLTGQ